MSHLPNYIAAARLERCLWKPRIPICLTRPALSFRLFFPLRCLHATPADDGHKARCHLCYRCAQRPSDSHGALPLHLSGTYFTHEAKGADDAADADTAIINAEGGQNNSEEKKEYFI